MQLDALIKTLKDAIVELNEDLAEKTTEEIIATEFDINEIIEKGITEARAHPATRSGGLGPPTSGWYP